eukprot:758314-Prymnesium_polylepis.1
MARGDSGESDPESEPPSGDVEERPAERTLTGGSDPHNKEPHRHRISDRVGAVGSAVCGGVGGVGSAVCGGVCAVAGGVANVHVPWRKRGGDHAFSADVKIMRKHIRKFSKGIIHPRTARWLQYWDVLISLCVVFTGDAEYPTRRRARLMPWAIPPVAALH